jgi:hypothetical protein
MEYSVKLARLPANLEFPARLQDRVTFDPAKEQLSYRGFMTKCAYDELSSLSDDLDYHRALEQLFVITSGEMAPVGAKRRFPAASGPPRGTAVFVNRVTQRLPLPFRSHHPERAAPTWLARSRLSESTAPA